MAPRSNIPGQRGGLPCSSFSFWSRILPVPAAFFPNILSERLTHAMEKMNMDVSTLALLAGVSVVTVKRWLNGTYEPRHENLPKIARELNVSTDYLHGKES